MSGKHIEEHVNGGIPIKTDLYPLVSQAFWFQLEPLRVICICCPQYDSPYPVLDVKILNTLFLTKSSLKTSDAYLTSWGRINLSDPSELPFSEFLLGTATAPYVYHLTPGLSKAPKYFMIWSIRFSGFRAMRFIWCFLFITFPNAPRNGFFQLPEVNPSKITLVELFPFIQLWPSFLPSC